MRIEIRQRLCDQGPNLYGVAVVTMEPSAVAALIEALRSYLTTAPPPAPSDPSDSPSGARRWDALTVRERAVADMAGRGLRNRDIARRLFISAHTVNYHLRNVFSKLEITSRMEIIPHLPGRFDANGDGRR
jgi:DNA-binding CsgD family transcriptional regulator